MDDIISRQAAIDEIKERFNAARNWYKEIQDNNGDEIMLARAETTLIDFTECSLMLKKLPSVQPEQRTGTWKIVEVLHGEWEGTKKYACDKCGEKVGVFKSNYCPNCGRRMEEGE